MRKMMIAAAALAVTATPALAQVSTQGGLVNVDVSQVLNNLTIKDVLSHNNVNVTALNGLSVANGNNVQVPIGLAANVCGTTVAVLSAATGSGAACSAQSKNLTNGTARALANAIVHSAAGK
jgi:hypothetical protein